MIAGAVARTGAAAISFALKRTAFRAADCAEVNAVCEITVKAPGALRLT